MRAWISIDTYYNIMYQAAKYDGKALLEATGRPIFEITVNPEFAKKEWSEIEAHLSQFGMVPDIDPKTGKIKYIRKGEE